LLIVIPAKAGVAVGRFVGRGWLHWTADPVTVGVSTQTWLPEAVAWVRATLLRLDSTRFDRPLRPSPV